MFLKGIKNKCHDKNQNSDTSKSSITSILELVLYKTIMIIIFMDIFYHNPF